MASASRRRCPHVFHRYRAQAEQTERLRCRLARAGPMEVLFGLFQAVLHEQGVVVALVQQGDVDARVELAHASQLAMLLRDQALVERGDLDVALVVWEEEVRREGPGGCAVGAPFQDEGMGFVLPPNAVEVQESGELALGVVGERDPFVGQPDVGRRRRVWIDQLIPRRRCGP